MSKQCPKDTKQYRVLDLHAVVVYGPEVLLHRGLDVTNVSGTTATFTSARDVTLTHTLDGPRTGKSG